MSNPRYASDANEALITMWKAAQDGFEFPDYVSLDEYSMYKHVKDPSDPMTAFVGFGCSFGGKWFDGYARSSDKNCYASVTKRSIAKKVVKLQGVKFKHQSYTNINVTNCLIYCDPPYANTKQYSAVSKFDNNLFWQTMREWVAKGNVVVVSEYNAPDDFVCVKEMNSPSTMRNGNKTNPRMIGQPSHSDVRLEKLFMHESQVEPC